MDMVFYLDCFGAVWVMDGVNQAHSGIRGIYIYTRNGVGMYRKRKYEFQLSGKHLGLKMEYTAKG